MTFIYFQYFQTLNISIETGAVYTTQSEDAQSADVW